MCAADTLSQAHKHTQSGAHADIWEGARGTLAGNQIGPKEEGQHNSCLQRASKATIFPNSKPKHTTMPSTTYHLPNSCFELGPKCAFDKPSCVLLLPDIQARSIRMVFDHPLYGRPISRVHAPNRPQACMESQFVHMNARSHAGVHTLQVRKHKLAGISETFSPLECVPHLGLQRCFHTRPCTRLIHQVQRLVWQVPVCARAHVCVRVCVCVCVCACVCVLAYALA